MGSLQRRRSRPLPATRINGDGAPDRRVSPTGERGVAGKPKGLGFHGRLTDRPGRWACVVTTFPQVSGCRPDGGGTVCKPLHPIGS
jgi:hypothetical protein